MPKAAVRRGAGRSLGEHPGQGGNEEDARGWHSFRTLIDDLATITRNTVAPRLAGAEPFQVTTRPTPLQRRAFKLLGVRL